MFNYYLNQSAEHKSLIDSNKYSEPEFAEPKVIKCRKEWTSRAVQRTDGAIVFTQTQYITGVPIAVGDLLDGRRVMSIDAPGLLGGHIPLYWSLVE